MSLQRDIETLGRNYCKAAPSRAVVTAFPEVYGSLLNERLFLPPLLVLDLLVAVTKPINALTPGGFASRPASQGWEQMLETVARRALPGRIGDIDHGNVLLVATARHLKSTAHLYWSLLEYEDCVSSGVEKLMAEELKSLSPKSGKQARWARFWEHLDRLVADEAGREKVIPFSSSFRSRRTDVFLFQELPAVDEQLDALVEELDVYRSRNQLPVSVRAGDKDPSRRRSDAGDFFERSIGSLPDNVARISPVDLVLLNAGEQIHDDVKERLRLRFALKVVESDINQRYHAQPDPHKRSRKMEVRVTLHDDRQVSSVPPIGTEGREFLQVNLYRATLVYFLHHFSQSMEGSPIDCDINVILSLGGTSRMVRRLPPDFLRTARRSPRSCFEALWMAFPQLFSAVTLRRLKETGGNSHHESEPSMLVLLSLGQAAPARADDCENICRADVLADPAACTLNARVIGFTSEQVRSTIVSSHDAPGALGCEVVKALFGQEGAA
jgi:hypothetical protein